MRTVYKNAKIGGKITDITVENGIITSLERSAENGIDIGGSKVFAGLIDIHTHGCMGIDCMDDRLEELSMQYARVGTTSFLATTVTASHEELLRITNVSLPQNCGANFLGFHLEGPYINKKKKGAQNPEFIQSPNISDHNAYKNIKVVTLAPEIDGAIDFIKNCGCKVCIGHTDADYETAISGIDAGADCLTHTFNAMTPLHHREPGVIGAAIVKNCYVQVICDGHHVHPAVILMLYKTFGVERMILISDSISAAGYTNGKFSLGGLPVTIADGEATLEDGTLAGSIATLNDCVKKAIEFGIPEEDAFKMASETPAKYLSLNKGILKVGYDADFIVVDENYNVVKTVIGGKIL